MIWDWIVYSIPWGAKVGAGLLVAGVVLRLFGWKATVSAIIAVATLGLVNRGQQQGWEARIKKDNDDAQRAINKARAARRDADLRNADAGELRKRTAISATSKVFCQAAQPITWADADTDETIRQVKAYNASYDAACR